MGREDRISQAEPAPFVINLAPTGIVPDRSMTPHVPLTHNEIVEDVARCAELGVQMFHLHARNAEGEHSNDPEQYGRLIEAIRRLPGGRELVLCVTTSGRKDPSFAARARVLDLDGDMKPDMASLTLTSLNFSRAASVNEPDVVRALAERMAEVGIRPELEIFDLGMASIAKVLVDKGVIPEPVYANILLGNIASAQTSIHQVAALLSDLPEQWFLSAAGLGRSQMAANTLALLYFDGARIGVEDNIWFDPQRRTLATNTMLVERLVGLAAQLGRPLMTANALRRRLALPATA